MNTWENQVLSQAYEQCANVNPHPLPDADSRTQIMQVRLKGTAALSFFAELQQARPKKVSAALPCPACMHALTTH